jgi:hypothetical protein
MKKERRTKLAAAIQELDSHHVRFLHNRGYSLPAPPDTGEQIEARTGILPAAVTICERAIIYSLFLQIDMLDHVLSRIDSEKAAQLKDARGKKRRLDPADRIYGDYRDVYFYLILDTLQDISQLQACFGEADETDWSFPRGLEKSETEFFILIKIRQVSSKAERLSRKK